WEASAPSRRTVAVPFAWYRQGHSRRVQTDRQTIAVVMTRRDGVSRRGDFGVGLAIYPARFHTISRFVQHCIGTLPGSLDVNTHEASCVVAFVRHWLIENHGLVAVAENAMFQVPGNASRQHGALQVAAFLDEVLHLIAMRDAHHILLNDRPVVQFRGDVMA